MATIDGIFEKIDQHLAEYYQNLKQNDYLNREGQGKFLQFVIEDELNEEDIEDELNDYDNCGYLEFDSNFPFPPELHHITEEQKRQQIFQILKSFYAKITSPNSQQSKPEIKNDYKDENYDNDPNITVFSKALDILCDEIKSVLFQKMNKEITIVTIKEFKKVVIEQAYETIGDVKEDILDTDSCILDELTKHGGILKCKQDIEKWIKQSIHGKIDMNIKNFIWQINFNDKLMEYTINLLKTECIAKNPMLKETLLVFRHPDMPTHNGSKQPEDVNLCIAKAIDIKNGYPILLWLVDTFSRYRLEKHKINLKNNVPAAYDNVANNYDPSKWFGNDNPFTKYLCKKYPNMSVIFKAAMQSLTKRVIPILNLRVEFFPEICDSLSMFAKYTLTFHKFCHQIQTLSTRNYGPFLPIQFDVWIIPQCVAAREKIQMQPFDGGYEWPEEDDIKEKYKKLGKAASKSEVQHEFWELWRYLEMDGYVKNEDYWVYEIESTGLRPSKLQNIWDQQAKGSHERYKRFIFVIDRRNPINIENKSVNGVKYNINKDEVNINNDMNNTWYDTVYLIKPKYFNSITKYYEIIPEQRLGLSSEYLFPNPLKQEPDPIKMLEAVNGYKFGLSFHISMINNAKCYFYYGPGAVLFDLNDMEWLWKRFFVKINKKYQKLGNDILNQIKSFKQNNKYFKDNQFEEFQKQTYDKYELE